MNLKKLYNKTLVKKDMKLILWLIVIATIALFIDLPMKNISYLGDLKYGFEGRFYGDIWKIEEAVNRASFLQIFMNVVLAISLGVLLIGEEKRKKTLDILWHMPYSKAQIYFNKILVGLISIIIPFLINSLIMIFMSITIKEIGDIYTPRMIIESLGLNIYVTILIFMFSILIGSTSGNSISQTAITLIFMILPLGLMVLFFGNLNAWGFHITMPVDDSPIGIFVQYTSMAMYLVPLEAYDTLGGDVMSRLICVGIYILSFGVIAYKCFKNTNMGRNGEVLAFKSLDKILLYGVTICSMMLLGLLLDSMLSFGKLGLLTGYVLGGFGGYKLTNHFINVSGAKN
ncbi:MAG: ABC transporter permease subunit [Anaeromicrobium sp.]|jgi:ABC-2 type transport system permease protein|uniref:ABC transporter permease subunit n=1 Tax=Anaeromicrobium sp. TaxID=1929132 RepID=UPI0025F9F606|nr:ABC transporter permease subunit [Anaeromicrobium sp.]MCT4593642.1 ABC transporter permease subunit [Anaeromicrobium sp.]